MKFLLKITAFMALLLISKLTDENENIAPVKRAVRATPLAFATYYQQADVPERLEEDDQKETQAVYE